MSFRIRYDGSRSGACWQDQRAFLFSFSLISFRGIGLRSHEEISSVGCFAFCVVYVDWLSQASGVHSPNFLKLSFLFTGRDGGHASRAHHFAYPRQSERCTAWVGARQLFPSCRSVAGPWSHGFPTFHRTIISGRRRIGWAYYRGLICFWDFGCGVLVVSFWPPTLEGLSVDEMGAVPRWLARGCAMRIECTMMQR
jgi:hypothetical protein